MGLLDGSSRTCGRCPVSKIAVADIANHPTNAAYSMYPADIAELAESIQRTASPTCRSCASPVTALGRWYPGTAATNAIRGDALRLRSEDPSLAGMSKERQAEMQAAMEPWRRTKRKLSDYVRSEGKAQAAFRRSRVSSPTSWSARPRAQARPTSRCLGRWRS